MFKRTDLLSGILLLLLGLISCERNPDQPDEAGMLASYLELGDSLLMKDYVNTGMPSLISAEELYTLNNSRQVYIIDIRSSNDFTAGHIENAHNVALIDLPVHIKGVDTASYSKVAVICHTGQSSGFAASILRLLGYNKVYALRWGMCSWHPDFAGRWKNTVTNGNNRIGQFITVPAEKNAKGNLPLIITGKLTAQEILEARVDTILGEGFTAASISAQSLFDKLSEYYIVQYTSAEQYNNLGHIPGAVQYTPYESMKLSADLKTLPADKPIAVCCSTGLTSAFLVAYLRLLGYNAKSVLYGTSGMIYSRLATDQLNIFNTGQIRNYPYLHTGP